MSALPAGDRRRSAAHAPGDARRLPAVGGLCDRLAAHALACGLGRERPVGSIRGSVFYRRRHAAGLAGRCPAGRSGLEYGRSRVLRIYVPFLAWSGIYLAFKGVKALVLPGEPNDFPGVELLWLGSFYHLWFMPFVFLLTLVVFGLARAVAAGARPGRSAVGETAVLVLAVLAGWQLALLPADRSAQSVGFGQLVLDALPSAAWALALAIPYCRGRVGWLRHRGVSLTCLAVAVALTVLLCGVGRSRLLENLSGVALLAFALGDWSGLWIERIARLGPLAYGIYLSHLLLIKTLEAIGPKLGLSPSLATSLAIFVLAAAGSTLLAWLLSRTRWTRWLTAS